MRVFITIAILVNLASYANAQVITRVGPNGLTIVRDPELESPCREKRRVEVFLSQSGMAQIRLPLPLPQPPGRILPMRLHGQARQ